MTKTKGVFAYVPIDKDQTITQWAGIYKKCDPESLSLDNMAYSQGLQDGITIIGFREPKIGEGIAQLCNDKRDTNLTNTELAKYKKEGKEYVYIRASRKIQKGEEIIINLGTRYWEKVDNILHQRKTTIQNHNNKNLQIPRTSNNNNNSPQMTPQKIIQDLLNRGRPHLGRSGLEDIIEAHLHTSSKLNTTALEIRETARWHSNNQIDISLGATGGTKEDFMANNFTWINLETEQTTLELMKIAEKAIVNSTEPARVVLLANATKNIIEETTKNTNTLNAKKHILMHIPRHSVTLNQPYPYYRDLPEENPPMNENNMILVIIDHRKAPSFDLREMEKDILNHTQGPYKQQTETDPNTQKDSNEIFKKQRNLNIEASPITRARYDVSQRPSLVWYRRLPNTESKNQAKKDKRCTTNMEHMENHNKLLGLLGILPKGMRQGLIDMGHNQAIIDDLLLEKIRKIIWDTTLEAYRRYESWRKSKKYDKI